MQASARRESLLKIVRVVVTVTAPRQALNIGVLAPAVNTASVLVCLMRDQAADSDKDNEHAATCADASRALAGAVGLLVFNDLDDSPNDQQHRPIAREPFPESLPGNHSHVA